MFTQLLGSVATVYGVLAALKTLLQTRQMLARRSSHEVSARFLASYASGYAIWLAYRLSTGTSRSLSWTPRFARLTPLADPRGSLIRPATWNSRNATSVSPGRAAPHPQPHQSSLARGGR